MTEEPILLEALNERELEIIPLLAEGLTNREIANRLFLAPNTVKWYIRQLNTKLDTSSREEIVERAEALGLMDTPKEDKPYLRPRTNLPHQTTPFIGRDAELDEIHRIIEKPDVRLLTILAPGGMGKTRIALEATEQQLNHFSDGVYFVPLQALSTPEQIIPVIAENIFFQFESGARTPKQQLFDFLSDRQILLCIDNWEHLLEGSSVINDILQATEHIKIIATSREKLNLLGETVYVLRGMQFPDWETPEDALEYDAVQLLVSAAQRVKSDWQLRDDNLDHVARICRLTQGMPLGILLATSWLDVYSLERIAEEIQQNADILESDMRDIPARQRSIRIVFEYTRDRLKPQEQDCLMKMSVFRGGCSPSAAETITGANARILQALVNKALLIRSQHGRYNMHELLRQYAENDLKQSESFDEVKDRHMHYYADAIHEREAHLQDARQVQAVREISGDFENVRVAWIQAVERERFDLIEDMHMCLRIFMEFCKRYQEVDDLLSLALRRLEHNPELNYLRAKLQSDLGYIRFRMYQSNEALQLLNEIHDFMRGNADDRILGYYLFGLGYVNMHDEEYSLALFQESITLFEAAKDNWGLVRASLPVSFHYLQTGRDAEQRGVLLRAHQITVDTGNKMGMAIIANNLSLMLREDGELEQAETILTTGIAIGRELAEAERITALTASLAWVYLMRGELEKAKATVQESLRYSREIQDKQCIVTVHLAASALSFRVGDIDDACQYAQIGHQTAREGYNQGQIRGSQLDLAFMLAFAGRHEEARHYLQTLDPVWLNRFPDSRSNFMFVYARIIASDGRHQDAVEYIGMVWGISHHTNWIEHSPIMLTFQEDLKNQLGEDAYQAGWVRGEKHDMETVVHNTLAELHEDKS